MLTFGIHPAFLANADSYWQLSENTTLLLYLYEEKIDKKDKN